MVIYSLKNRVLIFHKIVILIHISMIYNRVKIYFRIGIKG